jgi:hypothetical protein
MIYISCIKICKDRDILLQQTKIIFFYYINNIDVNNEQLIISFL